MNGSKGIFIISQVLNNNVVSAKDESGKELILTGKGLGFQAIPGEFIDSIIVEKIFLLKQDDTTSERLKILMEKLPFEIVHITDFIIENAELNLNREFSDSLFLSLADHLDFAVKRAKEGLTFVNPLEWEVESYYETEYLFAKQILPKVFLEFGVLLDSNEACSIALHIINADTTSLIEFRTITKIVSQILNIVKYYFKVELNEKTTNYNRFVTHLKFFSQRIGKQEVNTNHDELLADVLLKERTQIYGCVEIIAEFIKKNYCHSMSDSEKLYLIIHIDNLVNDVKR